MQFTPQQLRGAGRYNAKTRVGNWNEDQRLQEAKVIDYKVRKDHGQLAMHKMNHKLKTSKQKVPLTYTKDGLIPYGSDVMFQSVECDGTLATDVWEETFTGSQEYIVTISKEKSAQARNTFKLISPEGNGKGKNLRYGEPFYIVCNESLRVDENTNTLRPPLYLKSVLKSERRTSAVSDHQSLFLSEQGGNQALWVVLAIADGKHGGAERLLAEGQPVLANADTVIQHRMTGQALYGSREKKQTTDFGDEFEACCFTSRTAGRTHSLKKEFQGTETAATALRAEVSGNHFRIVTAKDPAEAIDNRNLPAESTPDVLCDKILSMVLSTASYGLRALTILFQKNVQQTKGLVDREDLKFGLMDLGVTLQGNQMDIVLDQFDKKRDGMINFEDFKRRLTGKVSDKRMDAINEAFEVIQRAFEGTQSTIVGLLSSYRAAHYPKVKSGKMHEDEARDEFVACWGKDVPVNRSTFTEFYKDVSPAIEDDEEFAEMLERCWAISRK